MLSISDKKSFFDFLDQYAEDRTARIYRGVSSNKFSLQPSIGRKLKKDGINKLDEKEEDLMFRFFKQRSKPYLSREYDDMNMLAIAQHHGLPTRLLDWTFNPLAAAYFAVEKDFIKGYEPEFSMIYIFDRQHNAIINSEFESIKVDKLTLFVPDYNDDRIINQNGIFTVHPYPWEPLKDEDYPEIIKVRIELSYRRELRKLLNRLGIHEATIYPGLDGLASHIRWMKTNDY